MQSTILNDLLKEYYDIRQENNLKLLNRKHEVENLCPRIAEIDSELSNVSISAAKNILKKNDIKFLDELKSNIKSLKQQKKSLLKQLGKPEDYLDPIYTCNSCLDTGYISTTNGSVMCKCLKQKLFDMQYNKGYSYNLKKENFNTFNFNLYSDEKNLNKYGFELSPRENIKQIYDASKHFIKNFNNPDEKSLIFSGETGLGKTFLSNCIVTELLKCGYTVMYQTAPVMLDSLVADLFAKPENKSNISENLLSVDLLVIDDLGTETMNSMKFTELYKIINTRLLNQGGSTTKTIISTNLDLVSLYKTYDERLVSRFIGYYNIYRFYGEDIRLKEQKGTL